ncbi:GM12781 [Drosophila sechellia]|uniref:GM12781 n=1 Tax=Drosophila sechellia TaxID=7238 RepID=B4HYQ1_DROSE|nr:GM12781 [Drosophila sechellia]
MARFSGVVLLLTIVLLAVFVAQGLAEKNANRQKQQKPRPGNQNLGIQKNKRPKPQKVQKQKPNKQQGQNGQEPKVFTTMVPDLGRLRGRTLTTDWTGQKIMQFLDIPYGKQSDSGHL